MAIIALNILAWTPLAAQAQSGTVLTVPDQVVSAQTGGRQFPANALRGKLQVVQGNEILIDGKPERLSPGARIRGPNNMLVMTAAIAGQEYVVNFVRETYGNVHQVWLLTPEEAKRKTKLNTPGFSFRSLFEGDKPKVDDGKTPFDQLPKYQQ